MMCISLHHPWIFVPQILLDNGEINPTLNTPRRKGVPKIMEVEVFNLCLPHRTSKGPPQVCICNPCPFLGRENKVVVKMSHPDPASQDFKKPGSKGNCFILTRLALKDSNNPSERVNTFHV